MIADEADHALKRRSRSVRINGADASHVVAGPTTLTVCAFWGVGVVWLCHCRSRAQAVIRPIFKWLICQNYRKINAASSRDESRQIHASKNFLIRLTFSYSLLEPFHDHEL